MHLKRPAYRWYRIYPGMLFVVSQSCVGYSSYEYGTVSSFSNSRCVAKCDEMYAMIPCRVLRDVEAVRQEATLLREQMQIVKEDIKRVTLQLIQNVAYFTLVFILGGE